MMFFIPHALFFIIYRFYTWSNFVEIKLQETILPWDQPKKNWQKKKNK